MKVFYTSTIDPNFLKLEQLLDAELHLEFPNQMDQYAPHNKFKQPIKAILFLDNEAPIACGAIKEVTDHVEIKRMFVHPDYRGKGLSRKMLYELEHWAQELHYKYAILETGKKLKKAVNLYQSSGYQSIPNYGPYTNLASSICMKKGL